MERNYKINGENITKIWKIADNGELKIAFVLESGRMIKRQARRFGTNKIGEKFSDLWKNGVYAVEIKGTIYYVSFMGMGNQGYICREPEVFRETKTDSLKSSGRSGSKSLMDEVKEAKAKVSTPKEEKPVEKPNTASENVKHKEYDTIKACIENDVPVYLCGKAGTGKNYTLEQISWDLGLDFYFTNSIQQEYKLTGFIDAGGKYHETEFYKAFKNGGIFFLDEIDASIPEILVLLNAAIANKYFEFPNGRINAHENFRVVAAGNTVGSGADEIYTGRLVLDQATLDRFVIINFDYDERVELSLAKGNQELVDFVHELRKQADSMGLRATFSYRCIITVTKLEKVLGIAKVLEISVFKGMERDTINSFTANTGNKYFQELRKMQAA